MVGAEGGGGLESAAPSMERAYGLHMGFQLLVLL